MKKPTRNKARLSKEDGVELILTLRARFEKNTARHKGLDWTKVQARLESNPEKLWSLSEMEETGGEPDVVGLDKKTGEIAWRKERPIGTAHSTPLRVKHHAEIHRI